MSSVSKTSANDTLLRQHLLLQLVPEAPRFISTSTLQEKLAERGFPISLRTVQRDLNHLSTLFPLVAEKHGQRNVWFFIEGGAPLLRELDPPTALALSLAEKHLRQVLPQIVVDVMAPEFRQAEQFLSQLKEHQYAHWWRRVRSLPNQKTLKPAPISVDIWEAVSAALLENKQLKVRYLSRGQTQPRDRVLHPAGLVSRDTVSYLIAQVDGYEDFRQFALHRMQLAHCLDEPALLTKKFDIDDYIHQELNSCHPIAPVRLKALVTADMAWTLRETPLSEDQQLTATEDDEWFELQATVPDDKETFWWVFGLGEHMIVQQPKNWRTNIIERHKQALAQYE
mgnify:FL=1